MKQSSALAAATNKCPLDIEQICFSDPVLTMVGSEWNFSTMNPWRIVGPQGIETSSDSVTASDYLSTLTGLQIVSFRELASGCTSDLEVEFSNGAVLQVFSMGDIEDWTLNLPNNLTIVFP